MAREKTAPRPAPRNSRTRDPLTTRLAAALHRRRALLHDRELEAVRVFHGAGDGIEGLAIDRYGPVLVVQLREQRLRVPEQRVRSAVAWLLEQLGCVAAYRKVFPKDRSSGLRRLEALHRDPNPWIGRPVEPELIVREHGLRFLVRPYEGYATGLFLDHRDRRRWLRENAAGCRVLNLFAYTCAFSVAAAAGGASCVISVDASRKALEWGRRNFELNGLTIERHIFVRTDVRKYLDRARRKGWRYDLIIADPPAFGRSKQSRRPFVLDEELESLAAALSELLNPAGHLLLACNQQTIPPARLERAVRDAASGRGLEIVEQSGPPADFLHDRRHSHHLLMRVV